MGFGTRDEENPVSEDEEQAEKQKLRPAQGEEMELQKIPVKTVDGKYPEVILGQQEPLIKVHHLKYLLLGFNFFLTLLGLVLLVLSVWIRVDPEFWEYHTTLNVDNFKTVCVMFIIASVIILIVGFMGCFGVVSERRWLLIVYILVFGIIFLVGLAALVLMWIAPYSKTITEELELQLKKQINKIEDDSSRRFMDFIQAHLECCGGKDSRDYINRLIPDSCQSEQTGIKYTEGCAAKMLIYLRKKAGIVGGIALPILLVQLLAIIAAISLIKSLEVESRYFM